MIRPKVFDVRQDMTVDFGDLAFQWVMCDTFDIKSNHHHICLPFPLAMKMAGESGKTKALEWAKRDFNEFRVDQALPPWTSRDKCSEDEGVTVGKRYINPSYKTDPMFAGVFAARARMADHARRVWFGVEQEEEEGKERCAEF